MNVKLIVVWFSLVQICKYEYKYTSSIRRENVHFNRLTILPSYEKPNKNINNDFISIHTVHLVNYHQLLSTH